MTTLIVLLILLINLLVSFGLIALVYLMVVIPLREEIRTKSLAKTSVQVPMFQSGYIAPQTQPPANVLPSMDDIPEEAFYGLDEEEDVKKKFPTMEEVEETMSSDDPYSRLELDSNGTWKALEKLGTNEKDKVSSHKEILA